MKTIKGYTPFMAWSQEWETAKSSYNIASVIKVWGKEVPKDAKRLTWKKELGYRKNTKDGHERGEQKYEKALLGGKGELSFKTLITKTGKAYPFIGLYNDMRCAQDFHKSKATGQTIADAFGLLQCRRNSRPISVEVKVTANDPFYALVENLKQIKLMRFNEGNLNKFLSECNLQQSKGTWGIVLAPGKYFKKKTFDKAKDLLRELKRSTEARVAFCSYDSLISDGQIKIIESNWDIK